MNKICIWSYHSSDKKDKPQTCSYGYTHYFVNKTLCSKYFGWFFGSDTHISKKISSRCFSCIYSSLCWQDTDICQGNMLNMENKSGKNIFQIISKKVKCKGLIILSTVINWKETISANRQRKVLYCFIANKA